MIAARVRPDLGLLLLLMIIGWNGCAAHGPQARPAMPPPVVPWADLEHRISLRDRSEVAPEPAPAPPAEQFFTHTIRRSGETLMGIARWYTGDGRNWQAIARVNPAIMPERLLIGERINIPESLLIRREALPSPRPGRRPARPPAQPAPVATEPAKPVEMELFGPILSPIPAGKAGQEGSPLPTDTPELERLDQGTPELETIDQRPRWAPKN